VPELGSDSLQRSPASGARSSLIGPSQPPARAQERPLEETRPAHCASLTVAADLPRGRDEWLQAARQPGGRARAEAGAGEGWRADDEARDRGVVPGKKRLRGGDDRRCPCSHGTQAAHPRCGTRRSCGKFVMHVARNAAVGGVRAEDSGLCPTLHDPQRGGAGLGLPVRWSMISVPTRRPNTVFQHALASTSVLLWAKRVLLLALASHRNRASKSPACRNPHACRRALNGVPPLASSLLGLSPSGKVGARIAFADGTMDASVLCALFSSVL
jgi:hypothetical protein